MLIWFLPVFLVLLMIGLPVFFGLLFAPGVLLWLNGQERDLALLYRNLYNGMDSFPLMALPFFMLAGEIMNKGGITTRLSNTFVATFLAQFVGLLVAGVLQLLVQLPALMRLGVLPRPRWGWRHPGVRRVLKLMIPTLIGSSVAQVNLLLDLVIATFLVSGSVSWLYYSDRLMEFPLGLFGIALATVTLPYLSRLWANEEQREFAATLETIGELS